MVSGAGAFGESACLVGSAGVVGSTGAGFFVLVGAGWGFDLLVSLGVGWGSCLPVFAGAGLTGSPVDAGLVGSGVGAGVVAGFDFVVASAFFPLSFSDVFDGAPEPLPCDVPPLGRDAVSSGVSSDGLPAFTRSSASSLELEELRDGLGWGERDSVEGDCEPPLRDGLG